jgi:hypothetical protein
VSTSETVLTFISALSVPVHFLTLSFKLC